MNNEKFLSAVLSACRDYFNVNDAELSQKYSAKKPPPHEVRMVRGCFFGLVGTLKIPKSHAAKMLNVNRSMAKREEGYFHDNKGQIDTEVIIAAIQKGIE